MQKIALGHWRRLRRRACWMPKRQNGSGSITTRAKFGLLGVAMNDRSFNRYCSVGNGETIGENVIVVARAPTNVPTIPVRGLGIATVMLLNSGRGLLRWLIDMFIDLLS